MPVWPKEDGSPTPAHRTLDLCFAADDAAGAAVSTPEAASMIGGLVRSG